MKIAVVGKGGVGKTTLTSLLACHYAGLGRPVLAIDADPSPCLGPALGFPADKLLALAPIAEMQSLIDERTGANAAGNFFKLNPRVADLPDRFSQVHEGIRLLLLGAVQQGGAGCICPASTMLKQLVRHVLLARDEVVLLDLYAGVEHLGRGTAEAVDVMVAVAEPTHRSMRTVAQIKVLAADIGVTHLVLVGNKATSPQDQAFFAEHTPDIPVIGCLNTSSLAMTADRTGQTLHGLDSALALDVAAIARALEERLVPA
ncbi:MAG: cobyrinic acid ac-diamide synthase [Alphaproteobacteria bacterium CG_4_10_14_0_2_um_filter_63_37]|nr:MAG: cobyrinic acid ac-diamide synthase [Proteobacteria bacterium CG1_02_64_396]PJA23576.1 MAG: cobyrinic acid ac-diamide synthase [Alphaproteobacteria bacterium CG_4_10_14_0_2_um_filter_63_37]